MLNLVSCFLIIFIAR